jgi:hypothetical protein
MSDRRLAMGSEVSRLLGTVDVQEQGFGIPTGELGTVEQTNEEDAVVKWDDDGRKRLHQPSLKKI